MQGKRIRKRLWAGILAMMLLFTSVNLPAKAGVAASIGKYAMTIAGRAFAGAIVDVADDLDPDSPIHTLNYLLLGITQDKAAIMCKELLNDVEELNKEMNKSKDYLSDMMNDLEEKESKDALTAYINNMTDASGEVTTSLWLEYETYLIEAAEYAEDPTQTNHDNMVNAGNILFDHMDQLYKKHELTTMLDSYIGYASPYLPHIDPDEKKEQSNKQSYMDLLYDVCGTQYLFDHQKHAVLSGAINERIGTINQMIELQSVYVSHVLCEVEAGESSWSQSEVDALVYEFEGNQQKAINAINDIAEEYGEEINHMVSYDDIHIALEVDYEHDRNITTKVRESGVTWTEDRDISYKSDAKSTRGTMNCYRVGVDGETFIFFKDPVKASDLVEETEVWYRQAVGTDIQTKLRAESTDWYNLIRDRRREYECVSNLSQVYGVLKKNPAIYASYKNNFLALLREKGELTEVAGGGDAAYLFMNSKDIAKWDKLFAQIKGEAFINAKWGNLKNMPTDTNGFTSDAIVQSKNFCNDNKNVMVMMVESEETELTYGAYHNEKNCDIQIKDMEKGFKPGDIVEVKLKADNNYLLDTLYVDGELYADTLDYESMPKDENGYATFYFAMPYHSVTVSGTCVKDLSKTYTLTTVASEGVDYEKFVNGKWHAGEPLFFGDQVRVIIENPSGTYISNIELQDTEGNLIQKLSSLNEINFAMPQQDCVLKIECEKTGGGSGTLEDPYQIPDEATWIKYADLTAADDEHYKNAHYIVTNDITFADRTQGLPNVMSGFKLGANGSMDGQGHILSNPYTLSALFTENGGTIKNLIIDHAKVYNENGIKHNDHIAKAAGVVVDNTGLVDNCIVKNSSWALKAHEDNETRAGGIAYKNQGTIRNSGYQNLSGAIRASYIGGIAYDTDDGSIENSYFNGELDINAKVEGGAGGLAYSGKNATVDNCYVAGEAKLSSGSGTAAVIVPEGSEGLTVTNCYGESGASGFGDSTNSTAVSRDTMKSDDFKNVLNNNLKEDYMTWTRSDDENDGFPTFKGSQYYYLTEQVSGSGSIISTRENGSPISWAISEGEVIHLAIQTQDKYSSLKSLKVCKASDTSVVYKDFSATTETEVTFEMPAYDVVVIGEFTDSAEEYTIGVVQNGVGEYSVTNDTGKVAESAIAGEKIFIKVVPGVDYNLASIEVTGTRGNVIMKSAATEASFEMPTDNCTIYITFEKQPELEDEDKDGVFDIDSYEDLVLLAKQIQRNPEKYASASYEQTAHINCQMKEWALPIGTEEVPFNGTYNGNDYYIMALRPTKDASGLFGLIGETGKVSDLSVVDFDYEEAPEMAGGLAGINRGTINNCGSGINLTSAATIFREGQTEAVPITTLDSEIKAVKVAGGLVSVNEGTIKNSRNSANVSAETAGGIAGINKGVITNIYQTGEVEGTVAGGGAGTNSGTIAYGYSSVLVTGTTRGGVVGTSENTNIKGMFYFYDANEALVPTASGNQDDSVLGVTKKITSELKSKALADELNTLISSEAGLNSWVFDITKNEGYPRHEQDNTVTAIRQNVTIAKPDPNDPVEDDQNSDKPGPTGQSKPEKDNTDKVVDTGDNNVIMPYVLALVASAICLIVILGKKRGRN